MASLTVHSPRWLALIAIALLLSSCFEPPIDESLRLRFLPNGVVVLTSTVEFAGLERQSNPALERRLAQTRQAVLEGWDPWSQRFAAIDPAAERFSWEKRLGELHKGTRSAAITEPRDLAGFFRDTSIQVSYEIREGTAELVITPGTPTRATRKQRKEMERTVEDWTGRVAEYLAASEDLYRYLEDRPDRARPCFGVLFGELLSETDKETLEELFDPERKRVDRLSEAMAEVWDVLLVPKGTDHSLDEVSHLVYDPFPAPLTVRLPGAPLEAPEGFAVDEKAQTLTAAGPGLWQALRSLEGRWISPDPLLLYVTRGGQSQKEPMDLDEFLALPRRAARPSSSTEVRRAIEERLKPAPLYRVTFAVQPEEEGETSEPFDWEG
ncbi:MAG TPA: hypothetical protein VF756_19950 [Thermoanaerobaculia bacterium]